MMLKFFRLRFDFTKNVYMFDCIINVFLLVRFIEKHNNKTTKQLIRYYEKICFVFSVKMFKMFH